MPTLIVASRSVSYDQALAAAARFAGWAVLACDSNSIPARVDDPVVFVTTDLILPVIDNLRLALLEPTFDLLTRVPDKLLCRTVELATFADLERLQGPVRSSRKYCRSARQVVRCRRLFRCSRHTHARPDLTGIAGIAQRARPMVHGVPIFRVAE